MHHAPDAGRRVYRSCSLRPSLTIEPTPAKIVEVRSSELVVTPRSGSQPRRRAAPALHRARARDTTVQERTLVPPHGRRAGAEQLPQRASDDITGMSAPSDRAPSPLAHAAWRSPAR